jgi:hypothetical protein
MRGRKRQVKKTPWRYGPRRLLRLLSRNDPLLAEEIRLSEAAWRRLFESAVALHLPEGT